MTAIEQLVNELKQLRKAYANLMSAGRERIIDLGGDCDDLQMILEQDQALVSVTNAIAAGEAELKREPVARICKPHGLMFDAMGDPRTRYVRVTLNGSHCVMSPTEGDNYVQESGDDSDYIVTDVYLSEREFDDLPEHDGF